MIPCSSSSSYGQRALCYLVGAILPLFLLSIVLVQALFSAHVQPLIKAAQAEQARYYESYRNDLEFLHNSSDGLLTAPTGGRDAGPFLNPRVFWTPRAGVMSEPLVKKQVREDLMRFRSDWMKKYERIKRIKVDLTLFRELANFDHWDIEKNSPIEELISRSEFVPPAQLPIPDSGDLLALVKLRLMHGALDGDYRMALLDVHHLARLLLSTESQQLVLAGLAALDYERFAYRFYVEEKDFSPDAWNPTDRNITRRAHRTILATRAFLHLWTDPEKLQQIFLAEIPPIGLCSAINEAFPIEWSLRSRLQPTWPLEISLKEEYGRLDKIFARAQKSCRLRYLARLAETHAISAPTPGPLFLTILPYSRKVFGLRSSALNSQSFQAYDAEPL